MGIDVGTPMVMKKAAYGLVQAPLQWYRSVCSFMQSIGYHRLKTEPCCWIYVHEGCVKSTCHAHVDDFMVGGADGCLVHQHLMTQLKQKYQWGTWEHTEFVQCGIQVRQLPDYSIEIDQQQFLEDLEEINLSRDRSRTPDLPTTEHEKKQMRAVLGGASWVCGQTMFPYSVDVGMLLTTVPKSTVADVLTTNQLVRSLKKWKTNKIKIHAFHPEDEIELVAWADAAHANRPNGSDSTLGVFIGTSTKALREGREENVTPIFWRSSKAERTCRSPACAEALACIDAEDELLCLRVLWAEMLGSSLSNSHPDDVARKIPSLLITDAKNLFDKVLRPIPTVKGAEKRNSVECIAFREHLDHTDTPLRWVHGDAMIANSLTKCHEKGQMMRYIQMGYRWKIIYDETMMSA